MGFFKDASVLIFEIFSLFLFVLSFCGDVSATYVCVCAWVRVRACVCLCA